MSRHRWSHRRLHRLVVGLTCAGAVLGLLVVTAVPAAAYDDGGYVSNYAFAFNRRDGGTRYDLDWRLASLTASSVTAINRADAQASCDNCRTAAIAFEVVLVSGVTTLNVDNSSLALNLHCTSCDTAAVADQFVVASHERVELSPQGRAELEWIHDQFSTLDGPGATPESIVTGVETLDAEVYSVLAADVQFVPLHPTDHDGFHIDHHKDQRSD